MPDLQGLSRCGLVRVRSPQEDTGLPAPVNDSNGQYSGLGHVWFCYDLELKVEKPANTSLKRTFDWTTDSWDLFTGDSGASDYTVWVNKDEGTDSNWKVTGRHDDGIEGVHYGPLLFSRTSRFHPTKASLGSPIDGPATNLTQDGEVIPVKIYAGCNTIVQPGLTPNIKLLNGDVRAGQEGAGDVVKAYHFRGRQHRLDASRRRRLHLQPAVSGRRDGSSRPGVHHQGLPARHVGESDRRTCNVRSPED